MLSIELHSVRLMSFKYKFDYFRVLAHGILIRITFTSQLEYKPFKNAR